ncbi:MAG: hypothetical protein R2828_06655 [Saprospiraceae bacterium]
MIINTKSYPRAALIGNPSDGYFGKTIAFVFSNFSAEVVLYETPELEILPQERDRSIYKNINGLYEDVQLFGYYGGIRLLKAAIKKFVEYCVANRVVLDQRNFTIRYQSDIPNRLGLAGSSAIITACMKALMAFYNIRIPRQLLANLVLSVERDELGISAGLQDRVAQAYEQPVYMDFDKSYFEKQEYGYYETFSATRLKNIYIAYRTDLSEGSEVFHNDIRSRFDRGDESVVAAMKGFADLTVQAKKLLDGGEISAIGPLLDANFDLRSSIYQISEKNKEMVSLARAKGASAKFTGSGGAIIGTYKDEAMFEALCSQLAAHKIEVIKPKIVANS